MKTVRVLVEEDGLKPHELARIEYSFRSLFNIVGLPIKFANALDNEKIDIYYGEKPSVQSIIFIKKDVIKNGNKVNPEVITENDIYYFNFLQIQLEKRIISRENQRLYIWNDIIFTSYYLLSGQHEKSISNDRHGRPLVEESFLYKRKLLHVPIVNQYAKILKDQFFKSHDPLPLWPDGKKYAVAITHDVDYPEIIRWIEVLRYIKVRGLKFKASKVLDIICGNESFWKFKDWVAIESRYGLRSAFYFCGVKGNLLRYLIKEPNPFYDIASDKYKELLGYLGRKGFEVGMHASYNAYKSHIHFTQEKSIIEKAYGAPVYGNRHHYWRMNPSNHAHTSLLHEQAGLVYDCSICYEKRAGFRYGICSPFHMYEAESNQVSSVLELPTAIMDNHINGYSHLSYFSDIDSELDSIINSAKSYGGLLILNFHVRILNETFFPKWKDSFINVINKIADPGAAYCDIPGNIARRWLEREKRLRNVSDN